jgi:hypothetical protein
MFLSILASINKHVICTQGFASKVESKGEEESLKKV